MNLPDYEKNYRWIYTYDYAPDSFWEEWRTDNKKPSWIDEEADRAADRVRRDLPSYILLADSHFVYNGTWDDTASSMKALSERIPLHGVIHIGDLSDGMLPLEKTREIEHRVMSDMESLGLPVYVLAGNHDYNYFRGNPEVRYPEKPRFFIDDEKQKLRMVFIDSFDPKEEIRYGFTMECIGWLDEVLESMSEGYKAIVFSHVTPLVRLQAWARDIRNRNGLIGVLDRHAEKIMALITGHSHCDHLFNDLKNGQFPIISINCAKCEYFVGHKPEGAVVPLRRLGDSSQESFDIIQIDTSNNELFFTRFGAGWDRAVKDHKAFFV